MSKDYHALRPMRIADLRIRRGDRVALIGVDRAGAELLTNLITGATLPDTGRVSVFGRSTASIANSDEWLATVDRFGIVTERSVLLESMTVIQNLAIPFTLDVESLEADVRRRAERLAHEAGISESIWTASVGALDAAATLRVRIARALALNPDMLMLEHVSGGLSATDSVPIASDLRAIAARRGAALLALTADEPFAHALGGRVLHLDASSGRLRERRGWFGTRLG